MFYFLQLFCIVYLIKDKRLVGTCSFEVIKHWLPDHKRGHLLAKIYRKRRPRVGGKIVSSDYTGNHRIDMDISRKMKQLFVCFHKNCFKWSLEEWSDTMAFGIEIFGVSIGNIGESFQDSVITILFYEKMEMIREKTVGKNVDSGRSFIQ